MFVARRFVVFGTGLPRKESTWPILSGSSVCVCVVGSVVPELPYPTVESPPHGACLRRHLRVLARVSVAWG